MKGVLYLDHAATTPLAPEVLEAMLPYFTEHFGNASSRAHGYGSEAARGVERGAEQLAGLMDVDPDELVFTSGSTEAINLALKGVMERFGRHRRHLVTAATEHSAVLEACADLERRGYEVTTLPVDASGRVALADLAAAITPHTALCCLMHGNNETGVLHDTAALAAHCRTRGVVYVADTTQAVGRVPVHPRTLGVDVAVCSAHKLYGPKGVGALYVARDSPAAQFLPQVHGGGQQGGRRAGTLNVAGIVGLGAAAARAQARMRAESSRLVELRDAFERHLLDTCAPAHVNGAQAPRLPHISNLTLPYLDAQVLLSRVRNRLAISTGSACANAQLAPSHVLLAMGLSEAEARASIRVSFGESSTTANALDAAEAIAEAVAQVRAESPLWELHRDGLL